MENRILTLIEKKDLQSFIQSFTKNGFLVYMDSLKDSELATILEYAPNTIIDNKKYDMVLIEGTEDKIRALKEQNVNILSNKDFSDQFFKTNILFISMNENEKTELQQRADEFKMNISSLIYFVASNMNELKNADKLLEKLNKNKSGKKIGFTFRVNLKDKEKFTKQANSYGMSLGDYLIICALNFSIDLKFNK